ncbi:diacylglycerol kinase [Ahniella affigens]|uniref:Diacylglycerol kinase n=1 Tax=Ahniella affigens TaxID=2021234 RepID=A0A2P1PR60_9GAMM|nr:diacylglycerol kinase [Ahniella affigens]AVP97337.1 diacylglycerol kinase [Ahniella affigens]
MADNQGVLPRGPGKIWRAFMWSCKGLAIAFKIESSFRLEVYCLIVLGPLALWLGQTPLEKALLVGCLFLVLAAELLNSAIEQVVDRISPEFAIFAGRAKDMGSAAVFLTMLNVLAIWGAVLWPRLMS